jgi:hypothetical protein
MLLVKTYARANALRQCVQEYGFSRVSMLIFNTHNQRDAVDHKMKMGNSRLTRAEVPVEVVLSREVATAFAALENCMRSVLKAAVTFHSPSNLCISIPSARGIAV